VVDDVAVGEAERADVVGVDEHDSAALLDAAVAVVEAVDRGVELVVTAHGLQQQVPLGYDERGEVVDLVSVYDGAERRAEEFRIVAYSTAHGCVAAYFPETNVLVALDSVAKVSNTPASKSVVIRLEHRSA
jgi:hypothetical protein